MDVSQPKERFGWFSKLIIGSRGLVCRRWFWPLAICIIALTVRAYFFVAYGREWGVYSLPEKDAQEWDALAMNILRGRGYVDFLGFFKHYTLQVPFFSVFLSFIYFYIGHSPLVATIVQLAVSSLTCAFVFMTMELALRHRKAAIVSGVLCALYGPYIYYAHALLTETLFIFLFVLSIYFVLASARDRSTNKAILAGVFAGLAALTRAAFSSLLILFAVWYAVVFRRGKREVLRIGCVGVASFALVIFPWLLRSYLIHGSPVMATTGYWQLWTGANPRYDGLFYDRGARRETLWKNAEETEGEWVRRVARESLDFARENPYRYLGFCLRRLRTFWSFTRPRLLNFSPTFYNICHSLPASVFPFAPFGMILSARRRKELFLFLGVLLFFSGAHAVFGAQERYRLPLDWVIMGYASFFLCVLFRARTESLENWLGLRGREPDVSTDGTGRARPRAMARDTILWKALAAALAALVMIYVIKMTWLYGFAKKEPFEGYDPPSTERVEKVLKECNLLSLWEEQGKQMPSVSEIFQRRIKSGDHAWDYPRWIIIWTGEMTYISKSRSGTVEGFRFHVNANGRHLGDGAFLCQPAQEARHIVAATFREADVVTVVGYTEGEILGSPYIRFLDILPYEGHN